MSSSARPMLLLLLAMATAGTAACARRDAAFRCRHGGECVLGGLQGVCERGGSCSFTDPSCAGSGRRFGAFAAASEAERCVPERRCGDGVLAPGEECDDGNVADDDGCTSRCIRCDRREGAGGRFAWDRSGACYLRFDRAVDFGTAQKECATRGGHLVTFASIYEQDIVHAALLPNRSELYWIGLSDRDHEGQFVWVTGEPFLPLGRWAPAMPAATTPEHDCVHIGRQADAQISQGPLLWADAPCAETRGFLCERDPAVVRPADGHAYRALHQRLTWQEAVQACAKAGGYLAAITTEEEQAFLMSQFAGGLWLGATDREREGGFRWVSGEPFRFQRWAATEPDNFGGIHDCLLVAADRLWHDRPCNERAAALCELE